MNKLICLSRFNRLSRYFHAESH